MIHVPAGVLKLLYNPRVNWNYTTDPEPGIADRQIALAARARARRHEFDQRHALDPRQSRRLRWLVADGLQGLVVRRGAALFQVDRALCAGRGRAARQEWPHPGRGLPHHLGSDPSVRRCRAAGRPSPDQGPQRPPARGRRLFADVAQWPFPRLDGTHVPGTGERPAEPARRDQGVCHQAAVRRQALRGCSLPPEGPGSAGDGRARSHPVGRHHQLATPAAGLRRWPGRAPEVDRRRRRPRSAGCRRQSVRPLCDPHLAPGQGRGVDQRAVARAAARRRDRPLADARGAAH